jgi:hypothetical protein
MRVMVGTVTYTRVEMRHSRIYTSGSEARSRMYVGCSKVNHVHLYKVFWVGVGLNRLTSIARTSGLQTICGKRKFLWIC